jgi:pyrimidine operon attenuation protein/uracil phosphoribosyltransferase
MPKNSKETPNVRETIAADKLQQSFRALSQFVSSKVGGKTNLVLVGIQTRGALLAKRIAESIQAEKRVSIPVGELDITLYRDDFSTSGVAPKVGETHLDFEIDGKQIVLIDDVLFTGRTTRAAIDELIDFGRPASIMLAVLVDRGHRELPIQADFAALTVATKRNESVVLRLHELDGIDEITICDARPGEVQE